MPTGKHPKRNRNEAHNLKTQQFSKAGHSPLPAKMETARTPFAAEGNE
jgi:hypothetical protein